MSGARSRQAWVARPAGLAARPATAISPCTRRWPNSSAEITLALVLGPLHDVVDLLAALRHLADHDGLERLVVDLSGDIRTRRISRDAQLFVAPRRVVVDRA